MIETRWEGTRPVALVARGPLDAPVYIARVRGLDSRGDVERDFLGTSSFTPDGMEEIIVLASALQRGELLEIRDGLPAARLDVYDRFAIWDGKVVQRVDLAYALHVARSFGMATRKELSE